MYKPLPKEVTIKKSYIEGLGLFAKENIPMNTKLGISHVKDDRFENGYIRTPLGGFVNHADVPNCEFFKDDGDYILLRTIRPINIGHELTAEYWLYNVEEDND
jgi:SET domain-containing protein